MVRAAAKGVVDYSTADPHDINWRIRHRLLLAELRRQDDYTLLDTVHRHWLAYAAHGSLMEDSFATVKERADNALIGVRDIIFPWLAEQKPEGEKDTIKQEDQDLVARYIARFGDKDEQKAE